MGELDIAAAQSAHKSHSRIKHYEEQYNKTFRAVIDLYLSGRERIDTGPIAASSIDPDCVRSLNPYLLAEYLADVEAAIEQATEAHPEAALAYLRELAGLGDAGLSKGMVSDLIQQMGSLFERRSLSPRKYFHRVKQRRVNS
jgi:hypothetical protein